MAVHFCISNPCPLCRPPGPISTDYFHADTGEFIPFVWPGTDAARIEQLEMDIEGRDKRIREVVAERDEARAKSAKLHRDMQAREGRAAKAERRAYELALAKQTQGVYGLQRAVRILAGEIARPIPPVPYLIIVLLAALAAWGWAQ